MSLEATYQRIMMGRDEPKVMYLLGSTLREMARQLGEPVGRDSEGRKILDAQMYEMTSEGIFLLE